MKKELQLIKLQRKKGDNVNVGSLERNEKNKFSKHYNKRHYQLLL